MAARYRFRLEPVLRVRRRKEDILKGELASLKRACEMEKAVIEGLMEARDGSFDELASLTRGEQSSELDLVQVALYEAYLLGLGRSIEQETQRLDELNSKAELKLEEVVKASKDKKIVERLKEKGYQAYMREAARVEQNELDEVGTTQRRHRRELVRLDIQTKASERR